MDQRLRPPGSSGGIRLTERDRALLTFMAEHRLVLERQLERLVGAGDGLLRGRLRALVSTGYAREGRAFDERFYQICRLGLAAIDSELPEPRFHLGGYKHDVGLAWLWLAARGGTFGPAREVLGERRLRSHDGVGERPREPYGVRLGGYDRNGRDRLHYPDLLLIDFRGRSLALELELTPKGRNARELILGGYGADSSIDRVLYLVENHPRGRAIRRLVEQSARAAGLADRVQFQFVKPIRLTRDEPDARQAPERRRTPATGPAPPREVIEAAR
jgi:hypothetical protein